MKLISMVMSCIILAVIPAYAAFLHGVAGFFDTLAELFLAIGSWCLLIIWILSVYFIEKKRDKEFWDVTYVRKYQKVDREVKE